MTDEMQDRLEERLTRVETTLNDARPVEGSRVAVAFWVDDITALLAALRQSQDIEAAAHGRAMADALRRVSNREAFKYVNIDWTALGAALVGEYVAALAPKAEEAPR